MELGLKGKVALVTGASAGMGKACALALAREGCRVVMCSRDEARIREAAQDIEKTTKNKIDYLEADVSNKDDIEKLYGYVIKNHGTIHVLVNNTGGPPAGSVSDITDGQWEKNFQNTVMSVVRLTRLALPAMKKQRYGRIINITSTSVKQPIPNLLLSNSLRPSVIGFSKTVSDETAESNVTINSIAPGSIDTERQQEFARELGKERGKSIDEMFEEFRKKAPINRLGRPEEIGDMVAFLASERAEFITGTTIVVDGGRIRSLY